MSYNYSKLKGHIPDSVYEQVAGMVHIDGPKRCSHFLGQCAVESMNFTQYTENLNYSVQGLMSIFRKHFPNVTVAAEYARQPERIANKVYADRMGNSNETSGDGWRYRGRGALQCTGKSNYKALGDYLKVDLINNPDLVATIYPLHSAEWFFTSHNLWSICDLGVDTATITTVSKKINGGDHGLSSRIEKTLHYWNILQS